MQHVTPKLGNKHFITLFHGFGGCWAPLSGSLFVPSCTWHHMATEAENPGCLEEQGLGLST